MSCDKSSRASVRKSTLHRSQREGNKTKDLSNLTSSQLEAIIGASLNERMNE